MQPMMDIQLRRNIEELKKQAEPRDAHHFAHQDRVASLACALGQKLSLTVETLRGLNMAAILHDLGMVAVPLEIFEKTDGLTEMEFALLRNHPQVGYDMLKHVELPWPVADIVLQHHEHFDGSGYPNGLVDTQILDEAKILAVADSVEAITASRAYRPAAFLLDAVEEMEIARGTLYDPDVVDAFLDLIKAGELSIKGWRV